MYPDSFYETLDFCRIEAPRKKFRLSNKLLSPGSSTISLCLSFFIFVCFSAAANIEPAIADDPKIVVGILKNWPPQYTINEKTNQPDGFAVEIMNEISRITNLRVEYKTFKTWPDLNAALKERKIDVIPNMGITTERKQFFNFTAPVETARLLFFKRKTSTEIKTRDDLKDRSVSVVETNKGRYLLEENNWKNIKLYKSLEEALMSVLSGNTDALLYPDPPFTNMLQKHGLEDRIESVGIPLLEIKRGICTHRDDKALAETLNQAVLSFLNSNEYRKIYSKWHGKRKGFWTTRSIVWSMSLLLIIVAASVVAWRFISLSNINKTLIKAERRYRLLFENMTAGFVLFEPVQDGEGNPIDLIIVEANEGFERTTGLKVENVRGKRLTKVLPGIEKDEADWIGAYGMVALTGNSRQFERDSELLGYYYSVIAYQAGPNQCAVTFTDITTRKKAEMERERLLTAIEQTDDMVIITAPDGKIQYINPAFESLTGYSLADVLGQTPRLLKSGKQDRAFYSDLWATISSGKAWKGRMVNKRKDGTLFTDESTISPVKNAGGQLLNFVAVKRDITENIKLGEEKDRLEKQFLQAQKMESVGRLAGGVAHDYNNMLSIISGYTEMAFEKIDREHPLYPDLKEIHHAANRSIDITRQLLAFSRQQAIAPKSFDLNETVGSMLKMLRRLVGEDIDLVWHPGLQSCPVFMDPSQLDQILVNLCVNARDAIEDVGKIIIETDIKSFDDAYCEEHAGFIPGNFVMIAVSDDGCGFDRETQLKIFEPFFTTKELGKGTGLGLATVYGIIKQNNGFINVYSEPGKGTTFRIYLPLNVTQVEKVEVRAEVGADACGNETILLVEDEKTILIMMEMMLETLGYKVLTANKPNDAINIALEHTGRIDLMITDVVMPDMNGKALSARLKEVYPDLKVLFMSGYTANVIAHHGVLEKGINFIQKPCSKQDLSFKVRETLGEISAKT